MGYENAIYWVMGMALVAWLIPCKWDPAIRLKEKRERERKE
jgi:hypothetical protein